MQLALTLYFKEVQFTCTCCDWVGSELALDVLVKAELNLVCCPVCQNDDVRVINDDYRRTK